MNESGFARHHSIRTALVKVIMTFNVAGSQFSSYLLMASDTMDHFLFPEKLPFLALSHIYCALL